MNQRLFGYNILGFEVYVSLALIYHLVQLFSTMYFNDDKGNVAKKTVNGHLGILKDCLLLSTSGLI